MQCSDGTLYCGISPNVERRIAMHNGLLPGGAKYTRGRRPVTLFACAGGLTKSMAMQLERRIKQLPRSKKQRFVLACSALAGIEGNS